MAIPHYTMVIIGGNLRSGRNHFEMILCQVFHPRFMTGTAIRKISCYQVMNQWLRLDSA